MAGYWWNLGCLEGGFPLELIIHSALRATRVIKLEAYSLRLVLTIAIPGAYRLFFGQNRSRYPVKTATGKLILQKGGSVRLGFFDQVHFDVRVKHSANRIYPGEDALTIPSGFQTQGVPEREFQRAMPGV